MDDFYIATRSEASSTSVYTVRCTVYTVRCTVYSVHGTFIVYSVHCTVYSLQSKLGAQYKPICENYPIELFLYYCKPSKLLYSI